ncbi:MAG: hypothetical protein ACREVI_10430 [Steroidobacteraceae bacterium]
MRTFLGAPLLGIAVILASNASETPAARCFGELAGSWQGTGTVNGMAADMRMTWEPALDGQFQQLTLDNRMTAADGKEWHFKAQAFYRIGDDGSITGNWFDSRGISLPLRGKVDGNNLLTIDWGGESTERGRSSYRVSREVLVVTDEVLTKEGDFRVFGRTTLKRLP